MNKNCNLFIEQLMQLYGISASQFEISLRRGVELAYRQGSIDGQQTILKKWDESSARSKEILDGLSKST